jgi:hypothetical protein
MFPSIAVHPEGAAQKRPISFASATSQSSNGKCEGSCPRARGDATARFKILHPDPQERLARFKNRRNRRVFLGTAYTAIEPIMRLEVSCDVFKSTKNGQASRGHEQPPIRSRHLLL